MDYNYFRESLSLSKHKCLERNKIVVNESNDDSFSWAERLKGRSCLCPSVSPLLYPLSSTSPLFRWVKVNWWIISANVADNYNI